MVWATRKPDLQQKSRQSGSLRKQENCFQPYTAEKALATPQASWQKHKRNVLSPGCHRSPFCWSVGEHRAGRQGSHPYLTTTTIHSGVQGARTAQGASPPQSERCQSRIIGGLTSKAHAAIPRPSAACWFPWKLERRPVRSLPHFNNNEAVLLLRSLAPCQKNPAIS